MAIPCHPNIPHKLRPTRFATLLETRNWCTSLKIQPKSKSAMKKFRTDSSRSIGPLLPIETVNSELFGNKSTEASVVCKGKELDAEILGCTTMRIFSWCRSAKHVKLTEWGLFVHASSLDQCTTGSLLKADWSGFFWFGSFGKPPNWRGSAEWVRKLKRSQGLRGGHVHNMHTTCTHCQVHLSQDHWFQNRWQEL